MSGLEFVASLVRSLAWPATVVAVVIILRRPIVELLAAPLKRFKVGAMGFEVEWREAAQMVAATIGTPSPPDGEPGGSEFRREMQQLARDASPAAAVVASLSRVEQAVRDLLVADGANDLERLNSADLVRLACQRELVDSATVDAVDGLGVMHMLALLDAGGRRFDMERAQEFIALAEAVLFTLRMQAKPGAGRPAPL